jgi:hypothetical protein
VSSDWGQKRKEIIQEVREVRRIRSPDTLGLKMKWPCIKECGYLLVGESGHQLRPNKKLGIPLQDTGFYQQEVSSRG